MTVTTVTCSRCAEPSPTDPPPLTWGHAVEDARTLHTCPACTREHLRAMEGKLDSEWW